MSESSDYMELSPSKFDQVSACEKLRDTRHRYLSSSFIYSRDGRTSPSPEIHSWTCTFRQTGHDQEKRGDGASLSNPSHHVLSQTARIIRFSTSVEEENNFVPSSC
ncbi:hypothetical protein TNCV_2927791 [Trichonephila clavipes]|nr:hypothetical protein TNCV_2927791 [Trichonephila clavipes]